MRLFSINFKRIASFSILTLIVAFTATIIIQHYTISKLEKAIINGDVATVKKIIKDDKRLLNISFSYGITPLSLACARRKENIVKFLILSGANVNKRGHRSSPLYFAVRNKDISIVKKFLDAKADVNLHYWPLSLSVLHMSVMGNDYMMSRLLLENNAEVDISDSVLGILPCIMHHYWAIVIKQSYSSDMVVMYVRLMIMEKRQGN